MIKHYYPNAYKPKPVAAAAAGAGAGSTAAGGSLAALPGGNGAGGAGASGPAAADPTTLKPTREGGLTNANDRALEARELATALSPASRVAIAAPGLSGSINLVGGVVDDLTLNRHRATVDKASVNHVAGIKPDRHATPTLGRKRGFIEDLFGNIGTVSAVGGQGGSGGGSAPGPNGS